MRSPWTMHTNRSNVQRGTDQNAKRKPSVASGPALPSIIDI
jgi:hypothetical protein